MFKRSQTDETGPVYLLELDQIIVDLREAGLMEWHDRLIEMRRGLPTAVANARMIIEHRADLINEAKINLAESDKQIKAKFQDLEEKVLSFMMKDTLVLAAEAMAEKIIKEAEEKAAAIVTAASSGSGTPT